MINSSYFEMKVKRNFLILKLKLIPIEIKLISNICIPSKQKKSTFFKNSLCLTVKMVCCLLVINYKMCINFQVNTAVFLVNS